MLNALNNQRGQGVLEYIILTSLIGMFCLVSVKQFGKVIEKRIDSMREQVVDAIPTK